MPRHKRTGIFKCTLCLLFFAASYAHAQAPGWMWANAGLGPSIDEAHALTVDGNGNCIIAGSYCSDSIAFASYTFHNARTNPIVATYDVFVAKYNASGNLLWAMSLGSGEDDKAWGVASDAAGNCYVTGSFASDTITFGTTTFYNTGTGLTLDIFLIKIDPSGNILWAKSYAGSDTESGMDVGVDASGNCLMTGYFYSTTITIGINILNNNSGNSAMFVTKIDPAGNVLWAESAAGTSNGVVPIALALDANGNCFVSGEFQCPSLTIGPSTIAAGGYTFAFIAKYNTNGSALWATAIEAESGHDIGTDAAGNCYVTGWYVGPTATFGTTTLYNSSNLSEFYLAKYDQSGNILWAKGAAGVSFDAGHSLCVDNSGNCYVTGTFYPPSILFDTLLLNNSGSSGDIFVVKFDNTGTAIWATSAGGSGNDQGFGIEMNGMGDLYLTGFFESPSLGFAPADTLASPYFFADVFVAKTGEGKTGIPEMISGNNFVDVFPNPSSGCIYFELNELNLPAKLEIFDAQGRMMHVIILTQSRTLIDLSASEPGIIFWRVVRDDEEMENGKFLIN